MRVPAQLSEAEAGAGPVESPGLEERLPRLEEKTRRWPVGAGHDGHQPRSVIPGLTTNLGRSVIPDMTANVRNSFLRCGFLLSIGNPLCFCTEGFSLALYEVLLIPYKECINSPDFTPVI